MGTFNWIIGILLFIVCLGVLVTIHELGHFLTAKLFKVYCVEFSVGFGPALYSRKKQNKETKFSIRAFPLGGFVSMVGEDNRDVLQIDVSEDRTIEGIKKWKRAIVYVAGVAMNFILGFILIFVSCLFPTRMPTYGFFLAPEGVTSTTAGFQINVDNESITGLNNDDFIILGYHQSETAEYLIVDDNVSIPGNDEIYVLCVDPIYETKHDTNFVKGLTLFHRSEETQKYYMFEKEVGEYYLPDLSRDTHSPMAGEEINFSIKVLNREDEDTPLSHLVNLKLISEEVTNKNKTSYKYQDLGISFPMATYKNDFKTIMKQTGRKYATANTAIIKAFAQLIVGKGWNNVGGPVAIAEQITIVQANYGFSTYLYYAGIISCNLAIFNLIPFPGLDGWALLVVAIEGITRKKVPNKVKNIVSFIGLILLFALMAVVVVKDIIGLVI